MAPRPSGAQPLHPKAPGVAMPEPGFDKLGYLRLLRTAKLTHAQYRVLVTILTYTDGEGENAHPGYARLADECRMSKGTVSKCIAQLKRAGWLWQVSRGYPSEGGKKASVFRVRVPEYLASEGFPESTTSSPIQDGFGGVKSPPEASLINEDPWQVRQSA